MSRPDQPRQQIAQMLFRAFDARRNQPGRDQRGFQQSQIIAGKIEHFVQMR